MRTPSLVLAASVLLLTSLTASAHAAAPSCAPDPYEIDDPGTGVSAPVVTASIAVGTSATRAICQGRETMPGKTDPRDVDWFSFTAVEGQSYTVQATQVGSGLLNDADRGGINVGFLQTGADGMPAGVVQSTAPNGDRSTTTPLHAGTYLIVASTTDEQLYPDNAMGAKTIEGAAGSYTIKLTATAPPPVLKSITVSRNPVKGGDQATATLTFTSPLLAGGSFTPVSSSDGFVAAPGGTQVAPGGVTTWTVPISTRRVSRDTTVTISSQVSGVGPRLSVPLTVRK